MMAELKALSASPMKDELRGVSDFEIEPSPVHATLDRFQSEQRQAKEAATGVSDEHSHVRQLRFSSDAAVMDAAVSSASNQGRNRVLKANGLQGVGIYDITGPPQDVNLMGMANPSQKCVLLAVASDASDLKCARGSNLSHAERLVYCSGCARAPSPSRTPSPARSRWHSCRSTVA